jgi:two-component system chemotaxis response regulator CheY
MKKKKILLVDDLKEFVGLIRVFLSREFEVITANDGYDALQLLHDGYQPDAIVTDLIMPRLDGYQLISRLKGDATYQNIPVIVLSGVDKNKASEQLPFQSLSGYIGKPFISRDLFKELVPLLKQVTYYAYAS